MRDDGNCYVGKGVKQRIKLTGEAGFYFDEVDHCLPIHEYSFLERLYPLLI